MGKNVVLEIWSKVTNSAFGVYARLQLEQDEKRARNTAAIRNLERVRQEQQRAGLGPKKDLERDR